MRCHILPRLFRAAQSLSHRCTLLAEIDPQFPAVDFLTRQRFHRPLRTGDVHKVGMRKSSRLPRPPVNRDSNIEDISNFAEQIVEVFVAHVKAHVADEERFGGGIGTAGGSEPTADSSRFAWDVELDRHAPAFKNLLIESPHGGGGGVDVIEFDVAKSIMSPLAKVHWRQ